MILENKIQNYGVSDHSPSEIPVFDANSITVRVTRDRISNEIFIHLKFYLSRLRLYKTHYCSIDRKSKTLLRYFGMINLKNDSESQFEAVLY